MITTERISGGTVESHYLAKLWRFVLALIDIGKAAVGGGGLAIAILGALHVLGSLTDQHIQNFQRDSLSWVTVGGSLLGGVLMWAFRSRM